MFNDKRVHRDDREKSRSQEADRAKASGEASLSGTEGNGRSSSPSSGQEDRVNSTDPQINFSRVAIVHDWLNGMRGGEIVFEALLDLYPHAEVFTLVYEPEQLSPRLREKLARTKVHTSFINWFSFTRTRYRQLLPLLPFAIRTFDVYPFDLVISSSHCVAKGVKKRPGAFHFSYVHAPMRYMWERFDDYFGPGKMSPFVRMVARVVRPFLQAWDRSTAQPERIDVMVANSEFIAAQILRCYGRKVSVIYPFAKLERFNRERKPGNSYLMVGAFAPYKKTDLAIEAFARLGLPLKVVGQGQDQPRLWKLKVSLNAKNIEFLGNPSNEMIESLYSECKAFIFPGIEDFGITPLEAMASGAPVIAFGEGGACETVTEKTGILFKPQSIDSLCEAVMDVESGRLKFDEKEIRARAQFFTRSRFENEVLKLIPNSLK